MNKIKYRFVRGQIVYVYIFTYEITLSGDGIRGGKLIHRVVNGYPLQFISLISPYIITTTINLIFIYCEYQIK